VARLTQLKQRDAENAGQKNFEIKQRKAEDNRKKPVSLKTRYLFLVEIEEGLCQRQK
jgi:hypothetical protein